jgi:hypothetical protein
MPLTNVRTVFISPLLCLPLLLVPRSLHAQTFSPILSFQGRLCGTDGKPLPDGPYVAQFTMCDAAVGGTALCTETRGVTQVGGVFVAHLGSITAFPADLFAGGDRWLGMEEGADPEMAARFRLTRAPWAIRAAKADEAVNSDTIDGFHAADTPTANKLLALDADLLDGLHAGDLWTKAEGGPFIELVPGVPQVGAEVAR